MTTGYDYHPYLRATSLSGIRHVLQGVYIDLGAGFILSAGEVNRIGWDAPLDVPSEYVESLLAGYSGTADAIALAAYLRVGLQAHSLSLLT
jgi:hypothetical protein